MRPGRLLLAAYALSIAPFALGCGDGSDLPTGSWHPRGGSTVGGGTGSTSGASSSGGTNGATGSSGGGASSGGTTGSTNGSGGTASSSGAGGTSGMTMGGQPDSVVVTVDMTALAMQLLDETIVHVSVAPNGYAGMLTLSTSNLPSGVTAKFDHDALSLDGTTTADAVLTLDTATSAAPGDASFDVAANVSGVNKTATVALTVKSAITLHIPAGVDNMGGSLANPVTDAYGPYPIQITAPQGLSASNPVTVYFKNDDSVSHEIHAGDASAGFGHDPGPFGGGQTDPYVRQVNRAGSYDFYLHDQGGPITIGRVVIQ